ncbi:MAG: hypothetical protein HUK26_05825 [Duodenibacillus sp.]|nr:hypothetical protein [Duodenibacillus sp.]
MDPTYSRIVNPVTGLEHNVLPAVRSIAAPRGLFLVGNSLFFFNNGVHRMIRQVLGKAPESVACRVNAAYINGASLSWHDVESYFRPGGIGSYRFDENNEVVFRDPAEKLWDAVVLCDSTQGPIHPRLAADFRREAAKDSAICRARGAEPVFYVTWAYRDRPEMTARLADAIIGAANDCRALAVPAGLAFALAFERRPEAGLIIADKRHPTVAGTYLEACVLIESVYGADVRAIGFAPGVEPELAAFLRGVAHETAARFYGRPLG